MTEQSSYERGQIDGEVKARLNGHEQRLDAINGHIATFGGEMRATRTELERIANQMVADAKERVVVAKALKDEGAKKWSYGQKWVLGATLAVGFMSTLLLILHEVFR